MSNEKKRRHFTGQAKMAILRRHLVDRVPVSQLCEEHRIHPTLFYGWQKNLFELGAVVFDTPKSHKGAAQRSEDASAKRIAALEAKLQNKNEVVAELLEDHVRLKKELGEL